MKVLLITVRSDFGGGPRHVHQLVENLPEDVELYMAYPEQGDPYAELWTKNSRLKGVFYIPFRSFSIGAIWGMKDFVQKNKIEIVHSHGNGAGIYSRLLKLLGCKVKVIHTFHGITDHYDSRLKSIINSISGKVLRLFTDAFINVSNGEQIIGLKLGIQGRAKSFVVYNGIENPESNEYKVTLPLNVISLTRFDYAKNMDFAYEIAYKLKENNDIVFTWVGDGEDKSRLEKNAKEDGVNIDFIGFSNEPMKHMKQAAIYLSTSRFEGLPYALIEASSIGLPILATDVRGNNECVKNGVSGFLFKTVDEAVDRIIALVQEREILIRLSHDSREFFLEQFTIDRMLEKICDLYANVLKNNI